MCGIVGIYNYRPVSLQESYIKWCLKRMHHRGPDDNRIWSNNYNYITGFTRLSIRDLSENAGQPMLSACEKFCLGFNGEIYNTPHLKNLLKNYHINYKSTSDTEVLLYSLIHLGIKKTLEEADGIFAFAFYDALKNTLVLARDRMGIKPLYAGFTSENVIFSSQYDCIINHSGIHLQGIDASAIGNYLSLGYIPENEGAFNGTKMLLHGYYYEISSAGINEYCYYDYPLYPHKKSLDLQNTLRSAVHSQLVSDVPVGSFMSGGTDSTLVTHFANERSPIQSFTIGVKHATMDETKNAEIFSSIFKTSHNSRSFNKTDLIELIGENTLSFSEPFADYSSLPVLMLSRFAREKVTVALSGDGGDELFWGYPRSIKAVSYLSYYKDDTGVRRARLLLNKAKYPQVTDIKRHWNEPDFLSFYYHALFITGALANVAEVFHPDAFMAWHYKKMKLHNIQQDETSMMNAARKLEMDIHLQRILLKVDRASMHHSLEVRVPMLNNQMLEYSASCNFNDCINGSNGKWNLKKLLIEKSHKELVMQPKKGFTIPVGDWVRDTIYKDVMEKIMHMPPSLSIFFNRRNIEYLIKQHKSDAVDNGWFIWALYSLVNWHKAHVNIYKHNN